jgi:hypothetical protein
MAGLISKLHDEFAVEGPGWTVKELSVAIACYIALHIAVIWVIEKVENAEADPRMLLFYRQANFAPHLQVGRNEARKPRFISWPNEVAVLIDS